MWPGMPKLPKMVSLQCLKKEVNDEVGFLHADKHESFQQMDTMIFGEWYYEWLGYAPVIK